MTIETEALYTATATVHVADGKGSIESSDGALKHDTQHPEGAWAVPGVLARIRSSCSRRAIGACYESALANIARKEGVQLQDVVDYRQRADRQG
jgi:osmotically inducible protein OsmC